MQAIPASSRDEKPVRMETPSEVEVTKYNKSGLTRCQRIRYVTIIIIVIIILTIICTVYFDKNKKNKSRDSTKPKHGKDNSNEVMPKNNYFTGKYRVENIKDFYPFNPDINYLNKSDYSSEVLEDKIFQKNSLRDLESSDQKILSFKITFHHPIDTMEKMFQNNKDLLEVDLSNLNTHHIKSLANTFSGCQNLETAAFAHFDSSNVESMESTFEGCSKLTGLNLSSLNTSKVTSMKSMFKDCDSIIFLNLSNFNMNNVQDTSNMFYGCNNLKGLDLSSFNNIDNLFDPSSSLLSYLKIKINPNISFNINITTDDNLDISCNSGEDEKCSKCSSNEGKKYCCESCNDGYYLPRLEFPTFCKKCSIENCKKCNNELVCEECEDKLTFVNGKCMKVCEDSDYANCEKCRTEENKIHQCEYCKQGYFLDEDEVNCLKCDIDNCKTCLNKKNEAVCGSCEENYYLFNELCFKSCSIGEEEKCLSCAKDGTSNCLACNDYYYLPVNSSNKEVCEKCNIEHCLKCSDTYENDATICTECEKGYILSEDKCFISDINNTNNNNNNYISDINNISEISNIININNSSDIDNISNNNAMSDINNISDNNSISDINNISDNNSISDINNISDISTTSDVNKISVNIMSDTNNANVINTISDINNISDFNNSSKINEAKCTIGSEEKCKSCNNNEEHLDQCETCNPGYYLPIDDEFKQECRRCDIENCKICNGTIDSNICYECNDDFNPIYEEDKIKSCQCNPGYKLIDGKCEINYSFKATYYFESENENEKIKLLNIDEDKILEMIVDNNIEQPSNYFIFNSNGEHIVIVLLNLNDITSLDDLFLGVDKMINIEFSQNFDTRNIYSMGKMFYNCYSLNRVNVSIFNTENVEDMNNMFYNCSSLKEINLSNFASNNLRNVNNLFEGCSSLSLIDISGLVLQSISEANSMFEGLPSSGEIKINNNLNEEIKNQIPENWKKTIVE